MLDPVLRLATASEPLSLSEEYSMQRSWRTDKDKLTFIICLPLSETQQNRNEVEGGVDDREERMVGDVNLFLFDADEDGDDEHDGQSGERGIVGEIEVMIARKDLQKQGFGRAALIVFLGCVLERWREIAAEYGGMAAQLAYLRVRISETNERSINLFEALGFERTTQGPNYFGEVELRWRKDVDYLQSLKGYEQAKVIRYRTTD